MWKIYRGKQGPHYRVKSLGRLFAYLFLFQNMVCAGQQSCRAYYTTYVSLPVLGLQPGLTARQEHWLKKKAKNDYPYLCADSKLATFVLVTFSQVDSVAQPTAVTKRAYTTGPVTEQIGVTAAGPGLAPSQPIWGTRLETFVTTWQEEQFRNVLRFQTQVFLLTTKKPLLDALSPDDYYTPVVVGNRQGKTADKDALKDALDLINKIAEKNDQAAK